MQKKKKLSNKWIVTYAILIVALIALIYIVAVKIPQMRQYNKTINSRVENKTNTEFLANSTVKSEDDAPYLETGIDGIYFTADYDGKISFYKFSNGSFDNLKASTTETIVLPSMNNSASVKIYFVTMNDQTVGFGVYSNRSSENFPYAFIKAIPNNITDNYDYVAFVDYTITDYYSNNKTYESAYAFSKNDKSAAKIFELENEESFIPIELIRNRNDGFYYFTKNEDATYSLFIKTTVSGKEYPVSETLALPVAFSKNGALLLLETTAIECVESDTSFYLVESGAIDPAPIKQFKNDPSTYILKDNYIFNPTSKTVYDVLSDAEQVIDIADEFTQISDFDITDGGAKIAIAGVVENESDTLVLYEFATGNKKTISGSNLFLKDNPNIMATDSYIMFLSPAKTSDNIVNIVIPWDKIF